MRIDTVNPLSEKAKGPADRDAALAEALKPQHFAHPLDEKEDGTFRSIAFGFTQGPLTFLVEMTMDPETQRINLSLNPEAADLLGASLASASETMQAMAKTESPIMENHIKACVSMWNFVGKLIDGAMTPPEEVKK